MLPQMENQFNKIKCKMIELDRLWIMLGYAYKKEQLPFYKELACIIKRESDDLLYQLGEILNTNQIANS